MYKSYTEFDKIEDAFFVERNRALTTFNMEKYHYHNAYEIYYLVEGERYYFIRDNTTHIKKGDLVIIDMNELHKTLEADNPVHERILINFKKEFLGNILLETKDSELLSCFHKKVNVLRLSSSEQAFVTDIFVKMESESENKHDESSLYAKVLLTELLIFIARKIKQDEAIQPEHPNPAFKKVSNIVMFINKNYMNKLTLKSLSEHFYMSSFYLSRTFHEVTGFSFTEFLNSVRTKEACRLLTETKLNITQISEKTGYDSITHFGRTFKAITGVSPLQYRKKMTRG